jgi:Fe-S-cluster-containing dehydrogenase component
MLWVSKNFKRQEADLKGLPEDELVMMIDLDRCISCGACQYACQVEQAAGPLEGVKPKVIHVKMKEQGIAGTSVRLPLSCRHCGSPCEYHGAYNFWVSCPQQKAMETGADQCDACARRLEGGLMPACATRCSMKCIYFGHPPDIVFALNEKRLREMGDLLISA